MLLWIILLAAIGLFAVLVGRMIKFGAQDED